MTDHNKRWDDNPLAKLVSFWPLIIGLVTIISLVATMRAKVDNHEDRIVRLETNMDKVLANTDLLVTQLVKRK